MKLKLYEREKRTDGWGDSYTARPLTPLGKVVTGALVLVAGYALVADSFVDFFGDKPGSELTRDEVEAVAEEEYGNAYASMDPADRFTLQYGTSSSVNVKANEPAGNGLLGTFASDGSYEVHFNNACLNRTAYDIDGGQINGYIHGLYVVGEVSGDIPTAAAFAEVSESNPNQLIVHSGNDLSADLTFSGLSEGSTELVPANPETERILSTYGCETGITHVEEPVR